MFEQIETLDRQLLLLINGANSPFFDTLMWTVSGKLVWIPVYAALLYFMWRKAPKNWWILAIGIGVAILLADTVSVHAFKNVVCRYRPSHNLELQDVIHLVNNKRGGMYGFVSSHAANMFSIATFVSLLLSKRWLTVTLFVWAAIISYSRIYLGLHYPADVFCGALLGIAAGAVAYKLHQFLTKKYGKQAVEV